MAESIPNYLPGMEPENIQKLLDSFFGEINDLFPDKVIVWSEWNHARWDKAAGFLCKTLGYSKGKDFLEAYGYSVVMKREYPKHSIPDEKSASKSIRNSSLNQPRSVSNDLEEKYIQCPKCKRVIREGIRVCPDCGFKISYKPPKAVTPQRKGQKKHKSPKAGLITLAVIIVLLLIGFLSTDLRRSRSAATVQTTKQEVSQYTTIESKAIDEFKPISDYISSNNIDFKNVPEDVHSAIVSIEKIYKENNNSQIIKQLYYTAEALSGMSVSTWGGSSYSDQAQVYLRQMNRVYAGPYSSEILNFRKKYIIDNSLSSTTNQSASQKSALTMSASEKAEVKKYIEDRYDYYDIKAGKYSGDLYKDQVWSDTAKKFGISETDVTMIWYEH